MVVRQVSGIIDHQPPPGVTVPVLIELPTEFNYSRGIGSSPTKTWEGTYNECRSQYDSLIATKPTSMTLSRIGDSPHFRLTAVYGIDPGNAGDPVLDPPVNTYELEDNQLQQHTAQSKYLHTVLGSASLAISIVDIHDRWKAKKITYAAALAEVNALTFTGPGGMAAGEAYLGELARGVDSFLNFHSVFRRTIAIYNPNQIAWASVGVKKVWTTDQVIAHEQVVANANDLIPLMAAGYWFKLPPRILAATNQQTQLSWEYWFADEWSTLYYEPYTPA